MHRARPRILVTNDDGIHAPGLSALVDALHKDGRVDVYVCAPENEASASSHGVCTSVRMRVARSYVPGSLLAYKVWGRPADTVMLAITSNLFDQQVLDEQGKVQCRSGFDLIVSGINRGDNCGLHVIYSGTVAGAREAVCKDSGPAIALSLDSHSRSANYEHAAQAALPILLAAAKGDKNVWRKTECVLNVNLPNCSYDAMKGYMLTFQGKHCYVATWSATQDEEIDDETGEKVMYVVNTSGILKDDSTKYCDSWAVHNGWVSVTPLALHSCYTRILSVKNQAVSENTGHEVVPVCNLQPGTHWPMGGENASKALEGCLRVAEFARNLHVSV